MPDDNLFGEVGNADIGDVGDQTVPPAGERAIGQESQTQDQNIPFHEHPRWKEVYQKAQRVENLEKEIANLKTQLGQPKPQQEEWMPKTWPEVIKRAKEETLSEIQQQKEAETKQIAAEDQALVTALADLKARVGEYDERKLLEFCYNHRIDNVFIGYDLMKKIEAAEKAGEKQALRKKVAPIGSSAKTEGGGKQTTPYKVLKSRTLDDIVAEAAEKFS